MSDCPICFTELCATDKYLPCKHAFHTECIDAWLKCASTCPLCRTTVPYQKNDWIDQLIKEINSRHTDVSRHVSLTR